MKAKLTLGTLLIFLFACGELPKEETGIQNQNLNLLHTPFKCDFESCGGGFLQPTPTPTPSPTIQAVKDIQFCFPGGLCPGGYEDRGGAFYDGTNHNVYELFQSINAGQNYVSDLFELTRAFASTSPAIYSGYTRFSYCEPSTLFNECVDFYVKFLTYVGSTPTVKVVDSTLCAKTGSSAWDTPDCGTPLPRRGGSIHKVSPTGDSWNQCIGEDADANPHCFNLFIETVP